MGLEYLIDLFEYPQVHFKADIMTYDRNDTGGGFQQVDFYFSWRLYVIWCQFIRFA